MKQAMKEMLQQFIERDFSAYEMNEIIDAITNVEEGYKLIRLYRNRRDFNMEMYAKRDLRIDLKELRSQLENYGLTYSIEDLVDDGGVEV